MATAKTRSRGSKSATSKSATSKSATSKSATSKSAASKSAAPKSAAPKSVEKAAASTRHAADQAIEAGKSNVNQATETVAAMSADAVRSAPAPAAKSADDVTWAAQRTTDQALEAVETGKTMAIQTTEAAASMTSDAIRKVRVPAVTPFDPKSIEDLAAYSRKNVEAVAMAGTILTKGFETMAAAWFAFAKESMDQTVGTARSVMGAKTLREAVDLQSDFAKASVNDLIAESARFSEMGTKVTQEALSPIKSRVEDTVQRLGLPRAA